MKSSAAFLLFHFLFPSNAKTSSFQKEHGLHSPLETQKRHFLQKSYMNIQSSPGLFYVFIVLLTDWSLTKDKKKQHKTVPNNFRNKEPDLCSVQDILICLSLWVFLHFTIKHQAKENPQVLS